jgi:hypothetical protein
LKEQCVYAKDYACVQISGFRLTGGTGAFGLNAQQFAIIDYANMEFGAMASGRHLTATQFGSLAATGNNAITGNAAFHMAMQNQGQIQTGAFTLTIGSARAFTIFAYADAVSLLYAAGTTISGAGVAGTTGKRYEGHQNSVIHTNGGGANFFPGNAVGSVATGAQYV